MGNIPLFLYYITIFRYNDRGDTMIGIELNKPITYKHSSLRFFKENEHHVSRFCRDDVLLLVYDGILRFCEDGKQYELHPGEYHIQRHDSVQEGIYPSDAPKYLYVHFLADWAESDTVLPRSGVFEYTKLKTIIKELDTLAHKEALYITQAGKFYELLSKLRQPKSDDSAAAKIANYIAKECHHTISLEMLSREFYFSKNHIIDIFKKTFKMTPIVYTNYLRLRKAERLMEVTSDSLESIAAQCGFRNYSHFYKLFCREYKLSPEQWRKRKRIG